MAKEGMPLVSVVIPTYNRAARLKRTLESALNQSFTDIEIIVVDDGSQDNTEEIVKSIRDPRIRFIKHPRNLGVSEARNTGIKAATGKFIAFLDSDDIWIKEKLLKQLIKITQDKADLCYTSVIFKTEDGKIIRKQKAKYSGNIFQILLKRNIIGTASSVMVRKETIKKVGLFKKGLSYREDYEMWLRIARIGTITAIEDELTIQIVHSEERLSQNTSKRISGFRTIMQEFHLELYKNPKALARHFYELGKLYLKLKNHSEACNYFIKALRTHPEFNYLVKSIICINNSKK